MPVPVGADAVAATLRAKQVADPDSLMAVIIAQAMNYGNLVMAGTSDIPYHVLEATYQQYLRQSSLQAATTKSAMLLPTCPIFPYYSFDLDVLYGSVDGQKFGVERRPSRRATRAIFRPRQGRRRLYVVVQPCAAAGMAHRRA